MFYGAPSKSRLGVGGGGVVWVAIVKCKKRSGVGAGLGLKFGPRQIEPILPTNSPLNVLMGHRAFDWKKKKKWIHKSGQKRILIDITEFKTNATNVIMHFCHIEKHLTVKHWFWARQLESPANKFCHHFLTLMSFQTTFFCWTQKKIL